MNAEKRFLKNIWMLATANLRKSKGNAISLALLMLFVAMFINIGFAMLFGIGSFFDQRAEELNTGHIVTHLSADYAFANAQMQFMQRDNRVQTVEIQDMLVGSGGAILNDIPDPGLLMFSPVYHDQQLNPIEFVGDSRPLTGNAIYVPHYMIISTGLDLGDTIVFTFMGMDLEFTVAGSFDDILFGSINAWRRRMYVSDEMFRNMQQQFPDEGRAVLVARLFDSSYARTFGDEYVDYLLALPTTPDSQEIIGLVHNFFNARNNHTLMPTLLGTILAVFAIVFLIVSLIVIRFRINNSIDEGMTNIGVLKALGYSNRQIVTSILMQFGLVAAIGGVVGMAVSQLVLPFVTTVMGPMFPFVWRPGLNLPAMLIMLAFILVSVVLFASLSTIRIYKLYPLVALRGGNTRLFRKNALPLDKFGGPLAFLFATKDVLQNKKQSIAIGIIVLAISYTAAVGLGTNYVVNINNEEFLRTMVGEPFDLAVVVRDAAYSPGFVAASNVNPQVDRITGFHMGVRYGFEDTIVFTNIVEDFSKIEGTTLVRGHFPQAYNEIAISTRVMNETGKRVGDWATVRSGGRDFLFLITGQTQCMDGMVMNITGDGARRMDDFEFQGFAIFLHEGVCGMEFAEAMHNTHGSIFVDVMIFDEIAEGFIESMGGIFEAVAFLLLGVVAAIVIATMYLVIKTAVLRRRRELGIQKALGFTTFQLMNQIALNLTPAIVIGSVIGAVLAYNTFNQFFVLVTGAAGDISVNIPISLSMTIAACVSIVVLAYVVSMAVAWRIRKISAYALVNE